MRSCAVVAKASMQGAFTRLLPSNASQPFTAGRAHRNHGQPVSTGLHKEASVTLSEALLRSILTSTFICVAAAQDPVERREAAILPLKRTSSLCWSSSSEKCRGRHRGRVFDASTLYFFRANHALRRTTEHESSVCSFF